MTLELVYGTNPVPTPFLPAAHAALHARFPHAALASRLGEMTAVVEQHKLENEQMAQAAAARTVDTHRASETTERVHRAALDLARAEGAASGGGGGPHGGRSSGRRGACRGQTARRGPRS